MKFSTRHIGHSGFRSGILIAMLALVSLAIAPRAAAQSKSKSSAEASAAAAEYAVLMKEYETAQEEFSKVYAVAKTDEERQKAFDTKYPKPKKYSPRFLELARKYPKDPAAVDALVWVGTNDRRGPEMEKALQMLRSDYVQSERIGPICGRLIYSQSKEAEKLLRDIWEKNPHHDVQGNACFSLASLLKKESSSDESEKLFNQVIEKYGDVKQHRGTLADAAKGELFEMHDLAIGKVAPDIVGKDLDGKEFKLSEYRGKVVVIDFFGDW